MHPSPVASPSASLGYLKHADGQAPGERTGGLCIALIIISTLLFPETRTALTEPHWCRVGCDGS